jgi:uncharacterized tellurite resistance protein B-like protein
MIKPWLARLDQMINKSVEFFNKTDNPNIRNPISPILKEMISSEDLQKNEIIAAKLGLALILIHADMVFDEREKKAFREFVKKECRVENSTLDELVTKILAIPEENFEMAYLGQVLTDSASDQERQDLLADLFKIARADEVYDAYEDKYIRLISQFLFINHETFIKIKNTKTV